MAILCDLCDSHIFSPEDICRSEVVPLKDVCVECIQRLNYVECAFELELETIGNVIDILESAGFAFMADYVVWDDEEEFNECDGEDVE